MRIYSVLAVVEIHDGEYSRAVQVPQFYLNSEVQGITDANHAHRVADDIIVAPWQRIGMKAEAHISVADVTSEFAEALGEKKE